MAVTNLDIMEKLNEMAVSTDTRLATLEQSLNKLNEAVYGNGEPGLKEKQREHEKRLADIEAKGPEPVREVAKALSDRITVIEKRHGDEDKIVQDMIEDKEQEEDSARKFRWETLAVAAALILNLIFTLIQSFIK